MPFSRVTGQACSPVLGIDFGTSNSAAALLGADHQLNVIPLNGHSAAMPTALFFSHETHTTLYGTQAMQAYLSGTEGRLMRAIKSLLGSKLMDEQTLVNGQATPFFDIVVMFFKELKARSEAHLGYSLEHAMLGRPVHFVDDNPERDALAQDTLGRAAQAAGFTHIDFALEPIAAAFDFEQRVTQETTALVVDIGGGTSDFTVIRLGPERCKKTDRASDILATTGVHLGGTDFDRLLNLECVMPLLGYKHIGPSGRQVPNSAFFDLATWHLIHHAYSRKSMHFARELWTSYADQMLHKRLIEALEGQHGHRILASIESAKIACSMAHEGAQVALDFLHSQGNAATSALAPDLFPVITPQRMGEALAQSLNHVVQCALQCIKDANLAAVDVVYLTGGSSALQPLMDALQAALPDSTLVPGDRFGGVAAGLAYAGAINRY